MCKKLFISLSVLSALAITTGISYANTQSPIYTDQIGREHFIGGGGYSSIRHLQNGQAYSDAVDSVSDRTEYDSQKEPETDAEKNVSNVLNSRNLGSGDKSYDYNPYTGADSGVNQTKSIYTDGLGRLHFFGKKNIIRE